MVYSIIDRYARVLHIITIVLIMAVLIGVLFPQQALAHAPSSVTVSYNYSTQNLTVRITHSVTTPSTHYVKTVTIFRNSNQVAIYNYTSQPTTGTFTYYYTVTASDGDSLSARADCSISGSNSGSTVVTAPDTTRPTIMITSPSNNTEVTDPTITISGTASDNKGINKVQVKINEGAWVDAVGKTSWTRQVTLAEGSNTIHAKAIDTSNNEAMASISIVYNATPPPDETPPVIAIQSPSDGSEFDVSMITVSGSSSDNEGVAKVELKVNSGAWADATGTVSWSGEIVLAEGSNTIQARATDTSDNTASDTITVTYNSQAPPDTSPPVVIIQAPADGAFITTEQVTVSGTASDDRGLALVEARVNLGAWNAAEGTTSWSIGLTLSEGMNTIEVRAKDDADNIGSSSIGVEYDPGEPPDTENPIVTITSPMDGASFRTSDITVSGTASDNSCPCRVEVSIDGGNWMIASGRQTWSIDITLTPGPNVIEARAIDDSGNIGFDTITVTYNDTEPADTKAPSIVITSPSDGSTVDSKRLKVTGTASDEAGLYIVEVKLNNGSWRLVSGVTSWSIDLDLEEGTNTITARAEDLSGNQKEFSISVTFVMPYIPGALDGVVEDDEYGRMESFDDGNFLMYWDFEGSDLKIAVKARTNGWVAIGFDPSIRMKDADILFGWVDDNDRAFVMDAFSTGENGPHPPDTELGGTSSIKEFGGSESDGWTTIEFIRPSNSTDLYDKNVWDGRVLDIIWGYGGSDDPLEYHDGHRGFVEGFDFSLSQPIIDDDDDDTRNKEKEATSIIMFVIIAIVAVVALIGLGIGIMIYLKGRKKDGAESSKEAESSGVP